MNTIELKRERALLMYELDEYYKRLEIADRYDNMGDREWYSELIARTEGQLDQLERLK